MDEDAKILRRVEPEDLLHYGLIPEFIGRLPVLAVLDELEESDLMRILREPKNALVKQYEKFFEFENVTLRFTEGALRAIERKRVSKTITRRGSARCAVSSLRERMS